MKRILQLLMVFCLCCSSLMAQQSKVSGTVYSAEDGMAVIGAAVIVKGHSSVGTVTNFDGEFELTMPAGATQVEVSYLGLETKTVKVSPKMKITLGVSSEQLDEVVVTGYQKIDRKMFTGSAATVKAEDAKVDGLTDVSKMLQGKAAGVQVQNVSGTFGAAPKIRVRGASSIYGDSSPLWVVDGVVLEDITSVSADDLSSGNASTVISSAVAGINADDIESFQILKDASATALYGARAMNGVIVITTKKGSKGTARINYTGEFTMREKPSYDDYNIMNSSEQMSVFLELEEKGYLNYSDVSSAKNGGLFYTMYNMMNNYDEETGFGMPNTSEARMSYLKAAETRNTDWFDLLFKNTIQQNHSISISTGSDKSSFYASLSYYNDPGWTVADAVDRYTANMNGSYNINDKVTIGMSTSASIRDQRVSGTLDQTENVVDGEYSRDFDINPFSYALNSSRTLDPDAYYQMNYADFNIFNEMENNYIDLNMMDTKMQLELSYRPIKGLDITTLGSVRYAKTTTEHIIKDYSNMALAYRADGDATIRDNNNFLYVDPDSADDIPETVLPYGGFYNTEDNILVNYYWRTSANYNKIIGDTHAINLMGGVEVKSTDRQERYSTGYGYQYYAGGIPYVDYRIIQQAVEGGFTYYGMSESYDRYVAGFITSSYSYKGTYTANLTGRYDGSNQMGRSSSSRWLPTWNVSGSWNIGNEDFMSDQDLISTFITRATYGLVATMGPTTNSLAVYTTDLTYRPTTSDIETYIYISQLENSELTWEKQNEFNFGVDFGILQNRISLSADAYYRQGFDLIDYVRTSGIGGEYYKLANNADMTSQGVEFTLHTRNVQTKDFTWTNNITFAHSSNKVTNLQATPSVMEMVNGLGEAVEGASSSGLYSIPFAGLTEDGFPSFYDENGDVTISGINFQNTEDTDYLVYEGNIDPSIVGGLENSFRYKNLTLDLYFTYQFGSVVRLNADFSTSYSDLSALSADLNDRWMMPGDEEYTNVPVIPSQYQLSTVESLNIAYNAYNYSTERVASGDFIKLRDITLGYDFSKHQWVKDAGLSNLSLRFVASNLWILYADSKLNGQDPEFYNSGGVAMPTATQYTLSVRLGL